MADSRNRRGSKNDKPYRRPRKKVCNFCVDKIERCRKIKKVCK